MLTILERTPELILATHGHVVMQSWRKRITLEGIASTREASDRVKARVGRQTCALAVGAADIKLPSEEVRKASAALMAQMKDMQCASATVFEGTGFFVSAARAAMSGIILLSRSPMPQKLFADIDEATRWIATFGDVDASELARAVRELRAQHPLLP